MNIQSKRLVILTLPILLPIALCVVLWQSVGVSMAQKPTAYGFVALAGNNGQINQAVAPFLADGRLRLVRQYGAAATNFQKEAPNYAGGTLPPLFNIKVYQVQTVTAKMNQIVAEVYAATAKFPGVSAEKDIRYLAYMPQQLILSGPCNQVGEVISEVGIEPYDDKPPITLDAHGACLSVGLYRTGINQKVADVVEMVNQVAQNNFPNVVAQPNQLMVGFPGNSYIFGSPAGMATPGNITPTLPTSPFAGTGDQIAVVVFDTAPYTDTPPISTQMINGKSVTVNQLVDEPPDLPFSEQSVVGSHGTFVATPITQLAPDSDIFLIRVLNQSAFGTEFWLIEAIGAARDYFLANEDMYNGVIFNYSLGLEEAEIPEPNAALSRTLELVHDTNIFQVAAAGNNSIWSASPEAPNLPASHPHVLGVTGVAPGNKLACYANRGDIATWGGGTPRAASGPCLVDEIVADCVAGVRANCLTGFDPHSPNEWAFGIGTSFASPLIAAMVAQRMETMPPSRSGLWRDPNLAREEIENEAILDAPEDTAQIGKGYIGDFGIPTSVGLSTVQQTESSRLPMLIVVILLVIILVQVAFSRKVEKIRE